MQAEPPLARQAIGGDPGQRGVDLALQFGVGERDRLDILQDDLLQSGRRHDADPRPGLGDAAGSGHGLLIDMHEPAAERSRADNADLRPLQRIQQIDRRIQRRRIERQVGKALRQRLASRQSDFAGACRRES